MVWIKKILKAILPRQFQESARATGPLDVGEFKKRKRERAIMFFLIAAIALVSIAEYQLTKVSSSLPFANSIFFFGLLNINLLLLIALVWLIFRNIGKIFIERRRRILGSRLKSKLVFAFLAFSITPTLILFLISSLYINSSFDKWFSIKVQNTLQASLEIGRTYYKNADERGLHFAKHISSILGHSSMKEKEVRSILTSQRKLLALNSVELYQDPFEKRIVSDEDPASKTPNIYPRLSVDLLDRAFLGENVSIVHHVGTGDLIRTIVPVYSSKVSPPQKKLLGVVAVNTYIPVSLVSKVDEIATVFDDYKDTNPLVYPIKTQYFVILIMITLVIIAVGIWVGLYLARELTVPIEKLVFGAKQVGAGNLDYKVKVTGEDEISNLVDSFNKMTNDLRENRASLTQATSDLEKRRLQLEAILANVGTGVLVVDHSGNITTFNRAANQLLGLDSDSVLGKNYKEVFAETSNELIDLIDRSLESNLPGQKNAPSVAQWNFHQKENDHVKSYAGIATPLAQDQNTWGVVVVIDDITHLIKSQREMAWREVARRIAHEIKNPLTPIKLSAQRLKRRLGNLTGQSGQLLQECTDTIVKHTDELKEMVNEFSSFARLPEISVHPNNLNEVIKEVHSLYSQAHPKIEFNVNLESKVPVFEFDRDQVKRVFVNLIDNSISALKNSLNQNLNVITINTHYNDNLKLAVATVKDNGPGMSERVKDRLFEPYFSTKKDGTGLGLAIAKRIINDHDGFIRVHSSPGKGTEFSIELPTTIRKEFEEININERNYS